MLASRLHLVTYREDPADAEVVSHRLMVRAGYIFKVGSGLYAYSPLMFRTLTKVSDIVRGAMNEAGALEMQVPILQEAAHWQQSGRWAVYLASGTMFVTKDRKHSEYGLAPTAEELMTAFMRATVKSYKQLPVNIYQIHTKFRDELRPRFGLLRVKEFLMKDAYSFDADEAGMDRSFEAMRGAYFKAFNRMGLDAFAVDADPGDIGGSGSIEFMLAADTGEDAILVEDGGSYAANVEKATSTLAPVEGLGEARPMRVEDTPNIRSVDELLDFFPDVPIERIVKTILFAAVFEDREELWAALMRGDQDINEVKLKNHTGAIALRMLSDEEIEGHTGAKQGFAGPVNLPETFQLVADLSVRGLSNLLVGINTTDKHALDVNMGRDFPEPPFVDIRLAHPGQRGPRSGNPLVLRRGIEAGHIFKLGTKYSEPMEATFMAEDGKEQAFWMGCYGIGISRIAAAAVEQHADEKGIIWPVPIAPFEVVVACLSPKDEDLQSAARELYGELLTEGVEAMLDDRSMSVGARLKDLELMGFPYVILVGRSWKQDGTAELKIRLGNETEYIAAAEVVPWLTERLQRERQGLPSSEG
jgi:prolyl-tRNA synthetase